MGYHSTGRVEVDGQVRTMRPPTPTQIFRSSSRSFKVGGIPGLHPGAFSAVPTGLGRFSNLYPGLASWATLSRPYGTHLEKVVLTHPLKPVPFKRMTFPQPR